MSVLLLAPLIAVVAMAAMALVLRSQRGAQLRLVGRIVEAADVAHPDPSILYFTGVACTVCHTAQSPALRALRATGAVVSIREIDVAEEPELARRYRVMSLPTTIVLDRTGQVTAVNTGFAGTAILERQVAAAGAMTEALAR